MATETEDRVETENYGMSATYSPEDNKLRLYALARLDDETYQRIKAQGFKWAPKQELFVAPRWTPSREDVLLDLCGEIGDEDYSAEDRAADRAERFGGYRDKRRAEAGGFADAFDAGPSVHGYQSQARADRAARRHDRQRVNALSQWSKAEYWQGRTAAVISHQLYKSSPSVRRSRIKRLEAEQRKHEKSVRIARNHWECWRRVLKMEDADQPETERTGGNPTLAKSEGRGCSCTINHEKATSAAELAYTVANYSYGGHDYKHPRRELDPERYNEGRTSLYSLLSDEQDPITPREAAGLYLEGMHEDGPGYEGGYSWRWSRHYDLRLTYERAMLADEGGAVSDTEMEPGGFVLMNGEMGRWVAEEAPTGWAQIHRVHKSNSTGKVTSVEVTGVIGRYCASETKTGLVKVSVERFAEDRYRPPTDEEREAFKAEQKALKAKKKAANAGKPKLINPTMADAQRLQDIWNAKAKAGHDEAMSAYGTARDYIPTEIRQLTQAEYSARSKGTYSRYETVGIEATGRRQRRRYGSPTAPAVCKVRKCYAGTGGYSHQADAVIVITDKPQKPLPEFSEVTEKAEVNA